MAFRSSILLNSIHQAVKQQAADLIFTFGCYPIIKIEGKLRHLDQMRRLSDTDLQSLTKELIPVSRQPVLQSERQVDFAFAQAENRFRVNAFFQRGHLSIVMRYVRNEIKGIDELGLPEITKDLLGNENGLILLVGPTGSGKSTSLAAMLQHLNENFEKHIITIEDPVEYVYDNKKSVIEQREVGTDAVSFPAALRSALREAPDVILLGEMRDLESISTTITVAETGHLVLSTVHASNAAGSIDRIIDIFPAGYKEQIRIQLSDILIAVLNQRLVPKADGKGYLLVVETMIANSAVRNAIRTSNTSQLKNIIQTSSSEGMHLLDELLVKAAKARDISKESALAYADDRNEVKKQIGGLL